MKLNFNSSKSLGSLYEGMDVGEIWGYLYDGFYTVEDFKDTSSWELVDGVPTLQGYSPRPGDYKFKNLNDYQYSDSDENDINSGKSTLSEPGGHDRHRQHAAAPAVRHQISASVTPDST